MAFHMCRMSFVKRLIKEMANYYSTKTIKGSMTELLYSVDFNLCDGVLNCGVFRFVFFS